MIDEKKLFKDLFIVNGKRIPFVDCDNMYLTITYKDLYKILKNQPKVGEWIPVEEGFPKEKEYVLIQNPYGVMSVACLLGGKWYNFQGKELWVATAWMPLPEPYRKEGER